jgi:hypothetical protein
MAPLGALSQAWVSAEASLPQGWHGTPCAFMLVNKKTSRGMCRFGAFAPTPPRLCCAAPSQTEVGNGVRASLLRLPGG